MKCLILAALLCTHGVASWYGPGFHGKLTANGERYDQEGMTAASVTLPLDSKVFVVNTDNGIGALLTITDRGPYVEGRALDVSKRAAELLGFKDKGLAHVDIRLLERGPRIPVYHGPRSLPPRLDIVAAQAAKRTPGVVREASGR